MRTAPYNSAFQLITVSRYTPSPDLFRREDAAVGGRWFFLLLAVLGVVYAALAGWAPLHDDELYYWCWSKELQLSYFDHPPLLGWLEWLGMQLVGPGPSNFLAMMLRPKRL